MHRVAASTVVLALACTLAACSSSDDAVSTESADTSGAGSVVVTQPTGAATTTTLARTTTTPAPPTTTGPSATPTTVQPTTVQPTTVQPTTVLPTTAIRPTTTVQPTTTTSTTVPPVTTATLPAGTPVAGPLDLDAETVLLGTSLEGRSIVAERHGTVGGRRVLVIGVIHGNEDAGVQVIDELRARADAGALDEGIEFWLVESMNPDGQAAQDRHNANQVDLNRNFPLRWGPIGAPGDGQYAGTGPASEPETQAMVQFISQLRPDIAVWYHQDANLIIPSSGRDGRLRARYADLTGLPIADCCAGGIYTGIAATWARDELSDQGSVAFIVELPGGELTPQQVTTHSDAVVTISLEG